MQIKLTIPLVLMSIGVHAQEGIVFQNESEAGIVLVSGNSDSQSINLKQMNSYETNNNLFKFSGSFLRTTAVKVESGKSWDLGLRYERAVSEVFSIFAGQNAESNKFAGYNVRYNTDLGLKYTILKDETMFWISELGYRFTSEDRVTPPNQSFHKVRIFTEANKDWTKTVSTKVGIEYLTNFSEGKDWQVNTDLSVSAMLSSIFSIKTSYLLKYDNESAPKKNADSVFTTALVAKF